MGIRKPSVFTVLSNLILPHLIPFLNYPDPNLVLPVFSNHTMYTMTMITRPRFLAMLALLAALCSTASACTGKPQCCLHRRMAYGTSRRKPAVLSRSTSQHVRRRLACGNCTDEFPCDACKEGEDAFPQIEDPNVHGRSGGLFDLGNA